MRLRNRQKHAPGLRPEWLSNQIAVGRMGGLQMAFVKVAAVAEIVPGTGKVVQTGGKAVAVFNVGGMFYALANRCTHMGGPLGEGKVAGTTVTCPWHGSRFDVTSGAVVGPPARQPVKTYPVRIESGNVLIDGG